MTLASALASLILVSGAGSRASPRGWQQPPPLLGSVFEYDLRYLQHLPLAEAWEHLHAVVAIAGIVNRDSPRLFAPFTARKGPGGVL